MQIDSLNLVVRTLVWNVISEFLNRKSLLILVCRLLVPRFVQSGPEHAHLVVCAFSALPNKHGWSVVLVY